MLFAHWREKNEYVVQHSARLQQLNSLAWKHYGMGLTVLRLADRPHRALKIDIAPERSYYFARAAASEQHQGERIAHGTAVGAARQPPDERRKLSIRKGALPTHLGRTFDTQRRRYEVIRKPPLFRCVCVSAANAAQQVSATTRGAIQHGTDDFVLQFAPRHRGCRAVAEPGDQFATQKPRALVAALLLAQALRDVVLDHFLHRIAREFSASRWRRASARARCFSNCGSNPSSRSSFKRPSALRASARVMGPNSPSLISRSAPSRAR